MTRATSSAAELDILMLGPVPPPFGGVSAHLNRLVPLLEAEGFRVGVLNHFGPNELPCVVGALRRNPVNYYRLPKRFPARVMHLHHSRWSLLVAFAVGQRRSHTPCVLTLHAPDIGRQLTSRIPFVRWITRWSLGRFQAVIAVNDGIKAAVSDHVDPGRVQVLPAFLTASPSELGAYEGPVEAFFDSARILLVAAYRVQFLGDGGEMYGLDTAVSAFVRIAPDRPGVRLALFLAQPPSDRRARRHLGGLQQLVDDAGLAGRVLTVFAHPLLPAFQHDVVFVRPTRSEGDAVSVREALQAGVPVVASDVVDRPAGVVSFPTGDVPGLCLALASVLDAPAPARPEPAAAGADEGRADSFFHDLVRVYRSLLGGGRPA